MRLTIDGRNVEAAEGMTILAAAKTAGIEIPTLCYLEGISDIGACRLCVVEVEGKNELATACKRRYGCADRQPQSNRCEKDGFKTAPFQS